MIHIPIGEHLIVDMFGIDFAPLNDLTNLEILFTDAAVCAKMKYLDKISHQFKPNGVSLIVLVEESHLSIHTYPEFGYAGIDIFTCGNDAKPILALNYIKETLKPEYVVVNIQKRGIK